MANTFDQQTTPAQPDFGESVVYVDDADRRVKAIDDNSVVTQLSKSDTRHNLLVNGGFDFAQRQAAGTLTTYSSLTGRVYGADRWGMTNETASIQYQRIDSIAAVETGLNARYYGKFKKITNAGKIAVSQVMEGTQTAPLRGRTIRIQAKMRFTVAASMMVRLGLLQLNASGTVDAVPAAFISAFNGSFADPTLGTNLAYIAPVLSEYGGFIIGSGVECPLSAAWQRFSATFSVPSNCVNMIPMIWSNAQLAANDELNIAEWCLYDGADIIDWTPKPPEQELAACQRFYFKTFAQATAPATSVGNNTGEFRWTQHTAGATAQRSPTLVYPVTMRGTPTLTAFNTAAGNAQVRNQTTGNDCTVQAFVSSIDRGSSQTCTAPALTLVGDVLGVHVTADAEL